MCRDLYVLLSRLSNKLDWPKYRARTYTHTHTSNVSALDARSRSSYKLFNGSMNFVLRDHTRPKRFRFRCINNETNDVKMKRIEKWIIWKLKRTKQNKNKKSDPKSQSISTDSASFLIVDCCNWFRHLNTNTHTNDFHRTRECGPSAESIGERKRLTW